MRAEFTHPVTANFFATPLISLLLLPAVAMPYAATLARALWLIGTVAMAAFAWLIVSRWTSVRHQATHATPGWMLPVVGLLNISIGGAGLQLPGTQGVATFALSVGLFFTIPLFGLILSRLIFEEPLPPPQQPSLMILMAPFAVGFLAYLAVTDHLDLYASSLFYLAVFMFAVLVPKLIRARSASSFHASWWAVSFPLAAMRRQAGEAVAARQSRRGRRPRSRSRCWPSRPWWSCRWNAAHRRRASVRTAMRLDGLTCRATTAR